MGVVVSIMLMEWCASSGAVQASAAMAAVHDAIRRSISRLHLDIRRDILSTEVEMSTATDAAAWRRRCGYAPRRGFARLAEAPAIADDSATVNLRQFDLNLLVALDVLLTERNVTRAGERLYLSQPAMSGILA